MLKASAILKILKSAKKWLVTSVVGKQIIKLFLQLTLLGLFLIGMAGLGRLPQSPLGGAVVPMAALVNQIPYFVYISYLVPVVPILALIGAWIPAIIAFHAVKFYLRKGGFLK